MRRNKKQDTKRKTRLEKRILSRKSRCSVEYLPDGSKRINLSPEAKELVEMQLNAFREKFGREPGPHDPVFFDPDLDYPAPLSDEKIAEDMRQMRNIAKKCKIRPEIAYAMEKTGMIPVQDMEDWNAAIEEFKQNQAKS